MGWPFWDVYVCIMPSLCLFDDHDKEYNDEDDDDIAVMFYTIR